MTMRSSLLLSLQGILSSMTLTVTQEFTTQTLRDLECKGVEALREFLDSFVAVEKLVVEKSNSQVTKQ